MQYDTNGNTDKVFQEHNGAVNTSTSVYVGYGYDNTTATLANGMTIAVTGFRPTTLQYPTTGTNTSRVITDSYGTPGGMDDEINQLDSIADGSGTANDATTGDTLDTVGHLGDGTIASETYNQPDIGYDLLGTTNGQPNLDQFGRVQNMFWANYANNSQTLDGYGYQFNQQGDVSLRANAVDAVFSEMYQNDKLDQLTSLIRGAVSDGAIAIRRLRRTFRRMATAT